MKTVVVFVALFAFTAHSQEPSKAKIWPKAYVQSNLRWMGPPSAAPGSEAAETTLVYFFEDHRYIAVQVTLMRGIDSYKKPTIIENEGYVVRSGWWQGKGNLINAHSLFVHLEALVQPYPAPVDERFVSIRKNWLVEGGSLRVAADEPKSGRLPLPTGGTMFVPVGEIVGIKDMQRDATAASCYYFKSHPQDANEAWNAVCKSTGK